jgi:UDP-N-acetylmuramoyl-tripeptide--D-alanyl-D-alanine ligase
VKSLLLLLLAAAALPYARWRFRHDLHMLQLNAYRPERYLRWIRHNPALAWQAKDAYLLLAAPAFALGRPLTGALLGAAVALLLWAGRPERPVKKPLVMTARARRALTVAFAGLAACAGVGQFCAGPAGAACGLGAALAASPLLMLSAAALLLPLENGLHRRFFNRARRRLAERPDLVRVGITGSYGKTSVKTYLHTLLAEHTEVLMTPGSFNTPMGVAKVINESLRPAHRVFLAEMGARQSGDIAELCRLVAPRVGVVTAIGEQHLETFGDLAAVRRTKWELPSAIPPDGLVVVCGDDANVRAQLAAAPPAARVLTYGMEEGVDVRAVDVTVSARGSAFRLLRPGRPPLAVETRLLGRHNVVNVCGAVAVATELGVPDDALRIGLRRLKPAPHRLELKPLPGRFTMLDDAFNSNPAGFSAALDTLRVMPGCRRFLVTPGMVELGGREETLNRELGRQAADCCDVAILVGSETRTRPLREGLEEGGFPAAHLHRAETLDDAFALLARHARPTDVVLFENDLPDSYR